MATDVKLPEGFVLDDEPVEGVEAPPKELSNLETVADYALSAVPIAGSFAGGAMGSVAGPVGAAAGGVGGNVAGKQVERYLREKFLGQKAPEMNARQFTEDVGSAALETAAGYGMGKAVSGIAKAAPKVLKAGASRIGEFITDTMGKEIGGDLLENGIVKPALFRDQVTKRAANVANAAGKEMGDLANSVKSRVLKNQMVGKINQMISKAEAEGFQGPYVKKLRSLREEILSRPGNTMSAGEVETSKRLLRKGVNFNSKAARPLGTQAKEDVAKIFQETAENMVSKSDPIKGEAFKAAKGRFGSMQPVLDSAEKLSKKADLLPKLTDLAAIPAGTTAATALNTASKIAEPFAKEGARKVMGGVANAATQAAIKSKFAPKNTQEQIPVEDPRLQTPGLEQHLSNREMNAVSGTPYADDILKSEEDGSTAQTMFLLEQTDPEFQELMKEANER